MKVPNLFTPYCWLSKTHIYQTLTATSNMYTEKSMSANIGGNQTFDHRRLINMQIIRRVSKSLIPRPQECLHNLERNLINLAYVMNTVLINWHQVCKNLCTYIHGNKINAVISSLSVEFTIFLTTPNYLMVGTITLKD